MINRGFRAVFVSGFVLVGLVFSVAFAGDDEKASGSDRAIRITSERMESVDQKGTVLFTGDVVAVKGKMTIRTDRLEVFYEKGADGKKKLMQIIASGNVVIREGDRTGTAETAVYDKPGEIITLSGNARVQEGENRIQGEKIILYINEDRSVVESGSHGKVEAIVYSGE
jgi:lipopolysaccharide export system protein LptA